MASIPFETQGLALAPDTLHEEPLAMWDTGPLNGGSADERNELTQRGRQPARAPLLNCHRVEAEWTAWSQRTLQRNLTWLTC